MHHETNKTKRSMQLFLKLLDDIVELLRIFLKWVCGFSTFFVVVIVGLNQFTELHEKFNFNDVDCTWILWIIVFCAIGISFIVSDNIFKKDE